MIRCECEAESTQQSEYSPGIVLDPEFIVYALIDPLTSSVKQISKSQLKEGRLSVCRAEHCSAVEARTAVVQVLIEKDPTRTDNGFMHAKCEEIRAIKLGDSTTGAFCVVDDGLPHYSAHAHLGYSAPSDEKLRNSREAARGNLLKLFQRRGVTEQWAGEPFSATAAA